MITVPARLLDLPGVVVHYRDPDLTILSKHLATEVIERASYTSTHVLSIVLSGSQVIVREDRSRLIVHAGEAALVRRGLYTVSDLIGQDSRHFSGYQIYFTGRGLEPLDGTPGQDGAFTFQPTHPLPADRATAFRLLRTLPGLPTVLASPFRRDPLHFLEAHFAKAFTLEDLAYLTGQSVSTFQRDFRARTGTSPRAWIVERRLAAARHLLREGGVASVHDAASAVGYRSTSHFIAAYAKRYGVTPLTDYRHFVRNRPRP